MQQVLKLSKAGGLAEAGGARAAYDLALTNLVGALANGADAKVLATLLQIANERLKDHAGGSRSTRIPAAASAES
jgi:hypothetical protein